MRERQASPAADDDDDDVGDGNNDYVTSSLPPAYQISFNIIFVFECVALVINGWMDG